MSDHPPMAHYKDLRDLYARSLEYHGIGYALYQPVAAADMRPPCAGFFDRNGNFNLIARLRVQGDGIEGDGLQPLEYMPRQQAHVGIEWKPKTSLGVQAFTVDASGEGPDIGPPASAAGHIKYTSKSSFGAVVIASKPVTMTGYNDERLFLSWLEANKESLLSRYGSQLKRYGMWIVTQTHTAPSCWINAWYDKSSAAMISLKAKANMLGELGHEVSLDDSSSDRDWTHYTSSDNEGVVVFMDGIEVKPFEWRFDSFKQSIGLGRSASSSPPQKSDYLAQSGRPELPVQDGRFLSPDVRAASSSPPLAAIGWRRASLATTAPARSPQPAQDERPRAESLSTGSLRTGRFSNEKWHDPASDSPTDEQMLKDVGISHPLSRSLSVASRSSVRSPSLRRESRRLS